MGWLGTHLKNPIRMFGRNRSGNVGMMFGLAAVPLLIAIGTSVDYGRVANVRTKLNGIADLATLASVSKDAKPFLNTPTQSGVKNYFNAIATGIPDLTISDVTASIVPGTSNGANIMTVTLTYTGQVKTVFGGVIGIKSVTIGGTSTARAKQPLYSNYYLLLDNSPSMGLGATPADITNLINATALQLPTVWPQVGTGPGANIPRSSCAFACHQHTFDLLGNGQITGDDKNDNYQIAKKNGITLRIDVLRTATQQLTQTATSSATMSNQFGMAVYTFSDTFQTIAPLSTNMSTVASNANAIDLAYAYWDQRDAQTSFDTALSYINGIMPNPGTGTSPVSPVETLFLVTDGVEDEPVGGNSGAGDPPDQPLSYVPPNNKPNLANAQVGNDGAGRLIDLIKKSACDTIKNRGINIAILYTPYQPVIGNGFYDKYVGATSTNLANNNPVNPNDPTDPAGNGIGQALKACASPGYYYQVTPSQGISAAMQALFLKAINSVLLTN
jgi:Flp pilus assembly protein TadG